MTPHNDNYTHGAPREGWAGMTPYEQAVTAGVIVAGAAVAFLFGWLVAEIIHAIVLVQMGGV